MSASIGVNLRQGGHQCALNYNKIFFLPCKRSDKRVFEAVPFHYFTSFMSFPKNTVLISAGLSNFDIFYEQAFKSFIDSPSLFYCYESSCSSKPVMSINVKIVSFWNNASFNFLLDFLRFLYFCSVGNAIMFLITFYKIENNSSCPFEFYSC